MTIPFRFGALLLAVLLSFSFVGCDNDGDGPSDEDVAGTYTFTQLLFDVEATSIQDADVLARLTNTSFELTTNGRVILRYTLATERQTITETAFATFNTSGNSVRVSVADDQDRRAFRRLLFNDSFTLRVQNDNTLSLDRSKTFNLSEFDPTFLPGHRV